MPRRPRHLVATLCLLGLLVYLAFAPVPVAPVAFTAPRDPGYTGALARNEALAAVERLDLGPGRAGPEDAAVDAMGRLYVSVRSSEILRLDARGEHPRVFARTGGVPLGLEFDDAGTLWVADAYRGLLSIDPGGAVSLRCDTADGIPIRYADDVDISRQGLVYFTDASTKFGAEAYGGTFPASVLDTIEHGRHGRLLRYDPRNGSVETLRRSLAFANGVAIDRTRDRLYLNETGESRVHTLWLAGPEAGKWGILIDGLPGFPDNVSVGRDGRIWIGLVVPRNAVLDATAGLPALRAVTQRLPPALRPKPADYGHLIAVDQGGEVLQNLQHPTRYTHITGAVETAGALFLTSLTEPALGRLPWPQPHAP